mmetsp:Transcript_38448/g.62302  ORF Transcript_38448/g.62302 Transcript_38448/m.62302 type:complete len:200 (+) Transcript_38448:106-705(+)
MLRRIATAAVDAARAVKEAVTSQRFVGRDKAGNEYFLLGLRDREPKRIIKYKEDAEPSTIPIEWHLWMRYMRESPPSEAEIERMDQKREAFAKKVAEIEAADAKRAIQQKMNNDQGGDVDYIASQLKIEAKPPKPQIVILGPGEGTAPQTLQQNPSSSGGSSSMESQAWAPKPSSSSSSGNKQMEFEGWVPKSSAPKSR